jgi:hypothetical protein
LKSRQDAFGNQTYQQCDRNLLGDTQTASNLHQQPGHSEQDRDGTQRQSPPAHQDDHRT